MKRYNVVYHCTIDANSEEEAREILEGILYEHAEGEDLDAFEIVEDGTEVDN